MAEMLTGAGLPMPVFEHRVVVDGHVYYLDLAWPDRMVAVECNDAGSHDTPKAFRRDPMKRNRCEGAGWRYLEFTWWDMVHESAEVVAQVAAALDVRLASGSVHRRQVADGRFLNASPLRGCGRTVPRLRAR